MSVYAISYRNEYSLIPLNNEIGVGSGYQNRIFLKSNSVPNELFSIRQKEDKVFITAHEEDIVVKTKSKPETVTSKTTSSFTLESVKSISFENHHFTISPPIAYKRKKKLKNSTEGKPNPVLAVASILGLIGVMLLTIIMSNDSPLVTVFFGITALCAIPLFYYFSMEKQGRISKLFSDNILSAIALSLSCTLIGILSADLLRIGADITQITVIAVLTGLYLFFVNTQERFKYNLLSVGLVILSSVFISSVVLDKTEYTSIIQVNAKPIEKISFSDSFNEFKDKRIKYMENK